MSFLFRLMTLSRVGRRIIVQLAITSAAPTAVTLAAP